MGLKCNHMYFYEREAEGDWRTHRRRGQSREVESGRLKDWTAVATSQSQPTATRT